MRIARKRIEFAQKHGKHRWVIERTMAWFAGYRRLTLRYERKAEHFLAFLQPEAAVMLENFTKPPQEIPSRWELLSRQITDNT